VIPGHGRLYDESDVAEYRDMYTILRDRVQRAIDNGMTLDSLRQSRPLLDYQGVFGRSGGTWSDDTFIEAMYNNLAGN